MELIVRDGHVSGYGEQLLDVSNAEVVETTESDLAAIFEQAKANGETLDGADASIDDAVEDPLSFIDFLIIEDETISFDSKYARESDPEA